MLAKFKNLFEIKPQTTMNEEEIFAASSGQIVIILLNQHLIGFLSYSLLISNSISRLVLLPINLDSNIKLTLLSLIYKIILKFVSLTKSLQQMF